MTLTCTPLALCSWDYRITGLAAGPATAEFNFFAEEGSVSLGAEDYTVRKHGWLSGHWSLERQGRAVLDAHKPNAFFRYLELTGGGGPKVTVQPRSGLTRGYDILQENRPVGTIQSVHPFTNRAIVECDPAVPELTLIFAFWLVVLMWKRDANNS